MPVDEVMMLFIALALEKNLEIYTYEGVWKLYSETMKDTIVIGYNGGNKYVTGVRTGKYLLLR